MNQYRGDVNGPSRWLSKGEINPYPRIKIRGNNIKPSRWLSKGEINPYPRIKIRGNNIKPSRWLLIGLLMKGVALTHIITFGLFRKGNVALVCLVTFGLIQSDNNIKSSRWLSKGEFNPYRGNNIKPSRWLLIGLLMKGVALTHIITFGLIRGGNIALVYLVTLGFIQSISGQEASDTLYLTSDDLIEVALAESPELELANIQYAIASLQYDRFETFLKPSLNLNAQIPVLNRAINVINQPDGQQDFINQSSMRNSIGASLDYQLASTGGRIYVSSNLERLDVFKTDAFPYSKSYFFTPVTLGIEQPLFQFNAIKWQKEILKRQEEQTDAHRVLEQEAVIYEVVSGFYNLELIRRRMELMRSKIADSRSLIRIKEQLFRRGSGSLAEMKQLALDTLQTGIEYRSIGLEYENKNRMLIDLTGLDREYFLIPVSNTDIDLPAIDLNTAIRQAIHNRARTSGIRLRMAQANRGIEEAEKDRGVALDVSASLGLNNTADAFSGLQYNFLDRELLSVGLRMPITDWGRRDINRQLANTQLDELQKTVALEERAISRQVIELYHQYQYLQEKMIVNEEALRTAEEIYTSIRGQYLRGQADWVSLQQNRTNLDNATLTYYQTRSDAVTIYYQIRSLSLYDFERNEELIYHEK